MSNDFFEARRAYASEPTLRNKDRYIIAAFRAGHVNLFSEAETWRARYSLSDIIEGIIDLYSENRDSLKFREMIINPLDSYYRFVIDDKKNDSLIFYDHRPDYKQKHYINTVGPIVNRKKYQDLEDQLNQAR